MCDYSLGGIPNRLAVEGEDLVVYQFPTGARGLASPAAPPARLWSARLSCARETPAVCVPPGARLLLRDIPAHLQHQFDVGGTEEVTFVQQSLTAFQYRDAVRFNNGREVLLQRFQCGQRVDVLSLSSGDFESEEHQRREEEYRGVFVG
jgi:hypothetical protein